MNFGGIFLAFALAIGIILSLFAAGTAVSPHPYVDTYGGTTTNITNSTQSAMTTAAPAAMYLGWIVIFFLVILLIVLAIVSVVKWSSPRGYPGHR